ncbi:MAG: tRNA pseudouridine(38-40) synthase TruA [Roseimicrobium sp.]
MLRLKLTVAYDGQPWNGWQSQPSGATVQDKLEAALGELAGCAVSVQGSGRTDAGVHAHAQVAHADVPPAMKLAPQAWIRAINVRLPHSIRVRQVEEVSPSFHARFSAIGKVYEYRLWRANVLCPFEAGRVWHLYGALDSERLRQGTELLCGTHNFARLSANRGDLTEDERREDAEGLTRTISRADVHDEGDVLRLEFEGDGFLYKMVRMMVGSLIHVARGREPLSWLRDLMEDPTGNKTNQTAPASGLYLVRVLYDDALATGQQPNACRTEQPKSPSFDA